MTSHSKTFAFSPDTPPTRRYGTPDPNLSRTRVGQTPIDELRASLDAHPAPLPERIGAYEVLSELGRGGMGVVYRALDPFANREVALKLLPPGRTATDHDVARFRREAETALRLHHPNIVRTFEQGQTAEGQMFIAMQLIDGVDLASQIARHGRLHPGLAARLIAKIAHAVDHAHRQGVLHRDIKPANLIVDRTWHPYLADFGLAKLRQGAKPLTTARSIVGSPIFMAPEATRGSRYNSAKGDIYGIGATLYTLLTGRPPFDSPKLTSLLRMVATVPPVTPSRLIPDIPPELDAVVLHCLKKDPRERPATALDVAKALVRGRPSQRFA